LAAQIQVIRHVYYAPLTGTNQLVLALHGLLTLDQIRQAAHTQTRAGQVRPLALPPAQILLDFNA